jgi:hypothetical protein
MLLTPTRNLEVTWAFLYAINKYMDSGWRRQLVHKYVFSRDLIPSRVTQQCVQWDNTVSQSLAWKSDTQPWLGQFLISLAKMTAVLYDPPQDLHKTTVTDVRRNNDCHGHKLLIWRDASQFLPSAYAIRCAKQTIEQSYHYMIYPNISHYCPHQQTLNTKCLPAPSRAQKNTHI